MTLPAQAAGVCAVVLVGIGMLGARPGDQSRSPASQPNLAPSANARIEPPKSEYRFPNRRTYTYTGEWHLFKAGTAVMRTEAGKDGQHVVMDANSAGVVNMVYTVHDRFQSAVDPRTFCSHSLSKQTEEGKRKRDTNIRFDYSRRKSVLDEKNLKDGGTKHLEHDIPGCVTDVISGLYYVASRPLATNDTYVFPLNDGGETNEITAKVQTREQVKTAAGTFQALRVQADPTAGPLKNKGQLVIWYTDDAQHTLVQMKARVKWGTVTFKLASVASN